MAMLAGPRRKQKVINLRAKNSEWSNDANKFGQRMLEKMGWSSGKGLGAKENGMVEHVVARYKNDEKGLGFEDKNDQWTKHEDDFNALLANLSNGDNNEDKLHSGVSLEVKSKKSKARVHYHKFTRGKDLTRYSEKDLANIFGKKSLKNEEKVNELLNEDITSTEQVFTEKGSMEDYFKRKLAAIKSKNKISGINSFTIKEDYEADYSFQGFSGTTNENEEDEKQYNVRFQGFSFDSVKSSRDDEKNKKVSADVEIKKKKKKKYFDLLNAEDQVNQETENQNNKHNLDNNSDKHSEENTEIDLEPVKKKKSKKNKQKNETISESVGKKRKIEIEILPINEVNEVDLHVPKKKKKRKNKNNEF